jgi:GH25 family lysozyme M1 (1,4-beta-N-acetylmuramidase)
MSNTVPAFPDLSHWDDSQVDYHAMYAAGIRMVGLKATQGTGNTDPTYLAEYARIKSVGVDGDRMSVLSYVFVEPNEAYGDDAKFLSVAHLGSGDIAAIDAEALGLSRVTTFAAMDYLLAKGIKTVLYCNRSFYQGELGSPTKYVMWPADYSDDWTLPDGVQIFARQYTDAGACPGVAGTCDMNRVECSDEEFKAFLIA